MTESITYGDYVVIALAQINSLTRRWTGIAKIGSIKDGEFAPPHTIIGPDNLQSSKVEAEYFAIAEARGWIEKNPHLSRYRST